MEAESPLRRLHRMPWEERWVKAKHKFEYESHLIRWNTGFRNVKGEIGIYSYSSSKNLKGWSFHQLTWRCNLTGQVWGIEEVGFGTFQTHNWKQNWWFSLMLRRKILSGIYISGVWPSLQSEFQDSWGYIVVRGCLFVSWLPRLPK